MNMSKTMAASLAVVLATATGAAASMEWGPVERFGDDFDDEVWHWSSQPDYQNEVANFFAIGCNPKSWQSWRIVFQSHIGHLDPVWVRFKLGDAPPFDVDGFDVTRNKDGFSVIEKGFYPSWSGWKDFKDRTTAIAAADRLAVRIYIKAAHPITLRYETAGLSDRLDELVELCEI